MKISDLTKKENRPLVFGAVALGGLALFFVLRQGSPAQGAVTASGPSEGFQLQAAQIAQQGQLAQLEASTSLAALQYQGQIQTALQSQQIQGQLALGQLEQETQSDAMAASLAALTAQLGAQQNIAAIDAQVSSQQIEAQRQQVIAGIQSNVDMFAMQSETQQMQAQLSAETILGQSMLQAQMFNNQLELNALESQFDRDIRLADIRSEESIELARISGDVSMNKQGNKTSRSNNLVSTIGGIVGMGLSLFSDVRLKSNIKREGETPNGLPLYSYEMFGQKHFGVMAQEVAVMAPDMLDYSSGDYMRVRYGAIS